MRKLLILLVIIIPLLILGILIYKNQNTNPQSSDAASAEVSNEGGLSSSIEVDNFRVSYFEITNTQNLKLIPNYSEKQRAKEIIAANKCQFLGNAGYYDKTNNPIGLVISEGNTISKWQKNTLFDGILSVNYLLTPRITRNIPQDNLKIAVQTGPIIKENGSFINLKIIEDKESRRVLAGITGENKLFFLVIYNPNSEFLGPLLADIPNILKNFESKSGIIFADIINLDGGSASVFYTKSDQLFELSITGAFFCLPESN